MIELEAPDTPSANPTPCFDASHIYAKQCRTFSVVHESACGSSLYGVQPGSASAQFFFADATAESLRTSMAAVRAPTTIRVDLP